MDYKLFFNELKDFFKIIDNEDTDLELLRQLIKNKFENIAPIIHAGKIETDVNIPQNIYNEEMEEEKFYVYEGKDGYDDNPYIHEFDVKIGGNIKVMNYPEKGYVWTENEKEMIEFIDQILFLIYSRMKYLSFINEAVRRDSMTGAPNTLELVKFGEMIKGIGISQNYVGIFSNLKNYKYINQCVGMKKGNDLLRDYYRTVKKFLKEDEMIGRPGGDNFFVFVKKEHLKDFIEYISNINLSINIGKVEKTFKIDARLGIYEIKKEDSASNIIERASVAMNVAKLKKEKDIVYFTPEMMEKMIGEKEIKSNFQNALQNEEFIVYYQPKVNLDKKSLCGAEALVRWNRNSEIISPFKFISILEQENIICALDFYVLERACKDIRRWIENGIEPVKISVNFAKNHLNNPEFPNIILGILNKYNIDHKYIEVELTESSAYENKEALLKFIAVMKENRIDIAIDDFGTGYSSLTFLKEFNADKVKLDKSFIDSYEIEKDNIIIKNVVLMLKALNIEVIAEGVENKEQVEFLKDIGCNIIQGYFFDKPLPCNEFEKRLNDKNYN